VTPRPIAWLWPGRRAGGKLALFDGDPDLGKSLIALDLCARLSTGRPWPDGTPMPTAESALVISSEDADDDTILPRLKALGADLGRVFGLHRDEADGRIPSSLPSRTSVLAEVLAETRARLVVIDPLTAFLDPGVNPSSDPSVRRALEPLKGLAEKYGCDALLHRHLNKSGGRRALSRGLYSVALAAVCRSAWLVAPDPRNPGRAVLAQVKNNLAPPQPSLAYRVVAAGAAPTVSWLGRTDDTADSLLAAAYGPPPRLPEWLRVWLDLFLIRRDGTRRCAGPGGKQAEEQWTDGISAMAR
jgi:hypothetical protein